MDVGIIYIALTLITLSAGFILRATLILRYGWVGKDTFYHYLIAREIRREKKLPRVVDRFVEPEHYDYPPFLHYILSKIPERRHKSVQLISPLCDILTALVIFTFCFWNFDPSVALIAVAIYCFTPFALDISFYMGPRVIANFFLVVCLLSTYYVIISFTVISLLVATLVAALVLLTQRLAVQSLVAIILVEMAVMSALTPLAILVGAFFSATLLSKGVYMNVLRGHIEFVRIMSSRMLDSKKRKEYSSSLLDIKAIAFNLPVVLILPIILMQFVDWSPLLAFLATWTISLLGLSALWVFGEGYRHMANSVAPLAILASVWAVWSGNYQLIFSIIVVSFVLSLYKMYRIVKRRQLGMVVSPDILDAFRFIHDNGNSRDIVLTIPTDLIYHAAYFTGAVVAHSSGGFAKGLSFNIGINEMVKKGKVSEIIKNFDVKWIAIQGGKLMNIPDIVERRFGANVYLYETLGSAKRNPGYDPTQEIIIRSNCIEEEGEKI